MKMQMYGNQNPLFENISTNCDNTYSPIHTNFLQLLQHEKKENFIITRTNLIEI